MGKKKSLEITEEMMTDELTRLIVEIVAAIIKEDKKAREELFNSLGKIDDLDSLARRTELKIKIKTLGTVKAEVLGILKGSTNKLIIASIRVSN